LGCVALVAGFMGGVELVVGEQQCTADELHVAAQENDAARLRQLTNLGLATGVINTANADGFTPLGGAASLDNIAAMDVLLTAGADIDALDGHQWTALGTAAHAGNDNVARHLLQKGASVDKPMGETGWTALMAAAQEGRGSMISMLLQHGADVNARDTGGYTALMFATEAVQFDVVQLLLANGADPDLRANDGWLCSFVQLDRCRGKTAAEMARAIGHQLRFNKLLDK
jgi:ankyrin repeat protein